VAYNGPMRSRSLFALLALLVASVAHANVVDISFTAQKDRERPRLNIHIHGEIAGFELNLTRSDGKKIHVRGGGRPGTTRSLELDGPEGDFTYRGELTVEHRNKEKDAIALDFRAAYFSPLQITFNKSEMDLENRRLRFRLSRPPVRAEVQIQMDTGEYAWDGEVTFDGLGAGEPVEITWPKTEGNVLKIAVRAYDAANHSNGFDLYPWQVEIPHEEVHFASGKADIVAAEARKLEEPLRAIQDKVRKFGPQAQVRLYVTGHTDSVGTVESNRVLSLNRARAIGAWFKKRGLRIPIYYEGFGEQALKVPTADEVDEIRNRRADYILSFEEPTVTHAPFPPNWRKL
jgi:outer membrane protein OmpA-like peptidoglycan-associated protein